MVSIRYLRNLWWPNECLDDSCICCHDRQNNTGQKDQSQFVHVPAIKYKYKCESSKSMRIDDDCVCTNSVYLLHTYKHH